MAGIRLFIINCINLRPERKIFPERGVQIPGARVAVATKFFFTGDLTYVDPQYATCFTSPFWHLDFLGYPQKQK
jgi:hypothetical protein